MGVQIENTAKTDGPKMVKHFCLSSALHLEEQFSSSIYRDYLDREDWPADLNPDVFEKIRQHLTVLIEDSGKHEQSLHALSRQYAGDEGRDKTKIVRELELMEGFELSARDFYRRISSDPQFDDQSLREVFRNMADAEQRHADIVREIIDLVSAPS
ncbi:MAG TPA: hypothetical protein ENI81_04040 [Phycisphaerales bacterium]|nr:hypothetical protein [Phycisphaerales bacterium]